MVRIFPYYGNPALWRLQDNRVKEFCTNFRHIVIPLMS